MSLLLDTHVVLWWLTHDPALPDDIKARLDHDPGIYISAATADSRPCPSALSTPSRRDACR
jgi:hypothetical protein